MAYKNKEDQAEYNKQYSRRWYPSHKEQKTDYNKQYYKDNAEYFREAKRRRIEEIDEFVRQQKVGLCCKRCGNDDVRVLDFHHRDKNDKEAGIAYIRTKGWCNKRILQEIAKCEVLCSNCHRILHWEEKHKG